MPPNDANRFHPEGRIDRAHEEIGRTSFSPGARPFLAFVFLLLIVGVPLMQLIHESRGVPETPRPLTQPAAPELNRPRPTGLFDRVFATNAAWLRAIRRYADGLDDDSLLVRKMLPRVQTLLFGGLGLGNEEAYVGREGWLFFRPGLDHLFGQGFLSTRHQRERLDEGREWRASPQPDPVLAILHFQASLARRGIRLAIVPTPVKGALHPDKFSPTSRAEQAPLRNASWEQFLAELKAPERFFAERYPEIRERIARGDPRWAPWKQALDELEADRATLERSALLVYDPSALMLEQALHGGKELFLRSDTHWRPEIMELVAADLARFLDAAELDNLPEEEPPRLHLTPAEARQLGDVAALLRLPEDQALIEAEPVRIRQVQEHDGLWRPDPRAAVLVLGDSFANIYSLAAMGWGESAGLVEHLSAAWHRPLDALVHNDSGAHASRALLQRELKRGRDRLAGKKLVIWQFAVRELSFGDWKLLDMNLGPQAPSDDWLPSESFETEATVLEISEVPRPGSVPYQDQVCSLHLGDLRTDSGVKEDVLAYAMCMRDGAWTRIPRLRSGQGLRLRLSPLDPERIEGLMRSEIDGMELEDHAWVELLEEPRLAWQNPGPAWPEWLGLASLALLLAGGLFLLERRRPAEA